MSIIVCMIRENHAVAASDGRVMFEGHIAGNDDERDRFNKTFSLLDGKVVGAFSGLTNFDGRTASQHLQGIVTSHCKEITLFDDNDYVDGQEARLRLAGI